MPSTTLAAALSRIKTDLGANHGLQDSDDAAVLRIPPNRDLVQSVDFLPALAIDPYAFGRIAAAHAFSDIFAMGAEAHSAQVLVNVPYGGAAQMEEHIYQLLAGVAAALTELGATLLGGHTTEAPEAALGLAVNGLVEPGAALRKGGLAVGQTLVLTKGIGTGALLAAAMMGRAEGRWMEEALASMTATNQAAARLLRAHGATACTDITGFGLAGHLREMARASGAGIELRLAAIPLLPGAVRVMEAGVRSTLHAPNRAATAVTGAAAGVASPVLELLFDPQTSGGLVASVPDAAAAACVAALRAAGMQAAAAIGRVIAAKEDPWIHVC